MVDKYKYNFDHSTGILYKFYYGPITLEEIYSSWDYAIANNLIPQNTKGFILDYREAYFDIDLFEYPKIADYYRRHINIFKNQKIAIVTGSVKDIAIPSLVSTKDDGYQSKVLVTLESAIEWILS